jgi:hypothetical protein
VREFGGASSRKIMKIEFQGGLQSRRDLIYLHFLTFVRASSIIHALIRRHTKKKQKKKTDPTRSPTSLPPNGKDRASSCD